MIPEDHKSTYVGMFVLKLLDLDPAEGGVELPVVLPHEFAPFEPVLERLTLDGLVEINRKKGRYDLTERGVEYLGTLIDEAEGYIEEFDDLETDEVVRILRQRNLDPMRVRFLWGWYQGEFDDPVLFQERRGVAVVERDWASYLMSDAFFAELERDLAA